MNFDHHRVDYDRDGFVIVRQFLPRPDWDDLLRNLDRYTRRDGNTFIYANCDRYAHRDGNTFANTDGYGYVDSQQYPHAR